MRENEVAELAEGKSEQFRNHCITNNLPYSEIKRVYIIVEQYPFGEIGYFYTLESAQEYLAKHRVDFAYPVITSRTIVIEHPAL